MAQIPSEQRTADELTLAGAPQEESRSFWQVAWRSFARRWANLVALSFIGGLAVMSVIVPFVANSHPYTMEIRTDAGWERRWPLFANLTKLDLILLFVAACAVVYLVLFRRTARMPVREERNAARLRWLLILAAVALVGATVIYYAWTVPLSRYDYRAYESLIQEGQIRNAVFPPVHWGYAEQEPLIKGRRFEFPSADHWLGTDGIGRDALSRLLWSTRVVMGIGFVAQSIALIIGVTIGALIGYYARVVDLIGMRLIEIFEAIPTFILILIFVAIYGRDIFMIMVILGLTGWTGIARFTRAEFLRLRKLDYVQAAIASGLPIRRVVFRHMLPNGLTPVIVTVTFGVAGAVMSESGLSFLGVGVEPPTPSWGSMLNEAGNPAEVFRWWLAIAPGLMIFLTVFAYNIIGEGLRDAIDPRLNKIR